MESSILPLNSGSFWISVVLVAVFIAGVSAFFQIQSEESGGEINKKTLMRDGLLGAIVGTLGWVMVPESMEKVSSTFVETMDGAETVAEVAKSVDFEVPDLIVGNAPF